MPISLTTADFLDAPGIILDVRSPGEFTQGHMPNAVNFPLFSNAERAEIGSCYKHQGHEQAVELGLAIVGPKLAQFVQQAKALTPDRQLRIHCWRGGMRSSSMAWLMETAGFQVALLDHGYKGFRQWVRSTLATTKPILTLGGMTGTGKTAILQALAAEKEQILDLEELADHRGSSYGNLGLPPQPSTEQFENLIAQAWSQFSADRPIWVEAESRMVGTCRVPHELFTQMLAAPIIQLERSRSERIEILLAIYGSADRQALIIATERLSKRLGNERTQAAVQLIQQENLAAAINLVLDYYDKAYLHELKRRHVPVYPVSVTGFTTETIAKLLLTESSAIVSKPMLSQEPWGSGCTSCDPAQPL